MRSKYAARSTGARQICRLLLAIEMVLASVVWAAESSPPQTPSPAPKANAGEAMEASGFSRAPIRLTPGQRQAIGLRYANTERRPVEIKIHTVGRVDYDERKVAEVTLKVDGYIQDLFVDYTGKKVRKGDPLFTIYSPDLVSAQQEYLLAVRTEERLKDSPVPGAADSATQLLHSSRERLRLWDLTERQVRDLRESGKPNFYQAIYSPISGVVIEKMAFKGHRVEPGMMLYKIADLSRVWVYADIYEYEMPFVNVGQEARLSLSYYPETSFTARVAYVYPALDPKTRTVKVRFELENSDEHPLRPEMYGNVDLAVPLGEKLVVPRTAVLDAGRRQVAFVDGGNGQLIPREVKIGVRTEEALEVLDGLKAGERVVSSANFLVDSESKLQGAESMMGMMGSIGMGDWKMESARPMEMGGEEAPGESESHGASAATPAAPAANAEERRLGDFLVAVFPAEPSPNVGKRAIRVQVRDAAQKPVNGATVRFNYTMDMPGMGIEQAAAKELGDGLYEGMADFSMAGPWGLVVEIEVPGKPAARGKFTIRVAG